MSIPLSLPSQPVATSLRRHDIPGWTLISQSLALDPRRLGICLASLLFGVCFGPVTFARFLANRWLTYDSSARAICGVANGGQFIRSILICGKGEHTAHSALAGCGPPFFLKWGGKARDTD